MTAAALLCRLLDHGLHVYALGDRLSVGPSNLLDPELTEELPAHRDEILVLLSDGPLPIFKTRQAWAEGCWAAFLARAAMLEAQGLLTPAEARRGAWVWLEERLKRGPATPLHRTETP